jgi:hypothetical protein
MRKLALTLVSVAVVLSGCSGDGRAPTEPDLRPDAAIRCIAPGFPIKLALEQIAGSRSLTGLYPTSRPLPLALALARVSEIAALWTVCKTADARSKLAAHTTILLNDYRNGRLIGGTSSATATRVTNHINTMWQGVGFPAPTPPITPTTGANFGFGFFTPGTPLLVKTGAGGPADGAVFLPGNAFNEQTLVTILQRPNTPNPFSETGFDVFPPFYEIIASNASNNHYLNTGAFAVVGFCVDDVATPIFDFEDPRIAHIAETDGSHAGGFEVLEPASTTQYDGLGLDCEQFLPPIGSLLEGGFRRFAARAPQYLQAAVASLVLPSRLEAAVGKTGLGGLASSLSPFGVTDNGSGSLGTLEFINEESGRNGDPTERDFSLQFVDLETVAPAPLEWLRDSESDIVDYPGVVLRDSEGNRLGGAEVTVEMIQVTGDAATLLGTTTVTTNDDFSSETLGIGEAVFDDLRIDGPGTFKLRFTAPGAEPLESGTFEVFAPVS